MISCQDIKAQLQQRVGSEPFVFDSASGCWYSYNALWSKAITIMQALQSENCSQIIAIMENGFNLFSMYFACMIGNITIVPIDPHKSEHEIQEIASEHPNVHVIKDGSVIFQKPTVPCSEEQVRALIENIDLDKVYMITYTSGSTGHPKGVIHCLKNLFLSAADFGLVTGLNDSHTMCHVMPMTYMAGILNTILMPFFFGCRIAILPRFDVMSAVSFWKSVEKLSISAFWLSPTMLNILMTIDRKAKIKDYLAMRETLFFIGTAPLFENVRSCFEKKYGVKLLQSYGLSETLFISTETPDRENDPASVGVILPNADITIYDDGEIGIGVPWMFLGYSNEKTDDYFKDSNYLSGDLGKIADRRLYITGRKKDLIVKGGMNISPTQIENCINQSGYVMECAVAGALIHNEENIICWYVADNSYSFSANDVNKLIESKLGRHCRVDQFIQIGNIPKNLNGKTDKRKLLEEFIR